MGYADVTALCLYGRFNNRFSESSGTEGAEYIRKKLLLKNNVDVFIYSNDLAHESVIRSEYQDVLRDCLFEPGPDFRQLMEDRGIRESDFQPIEPFRTVENSLRFFYSRMRSLMLMAEHMERNGAAYSAAITARFDLGQIDKYNGWQPYRVSEINFSARRDMTYFYSAMWNQLNGGYADQWFYSSPELLIRLGDMFERSLEYLKPGSSYQAFLELGIPDSNRTNEFSNEMLKPAEARSEDHVRVALRSGVNNHLLHKFFLMEAGLYEKSRFTSDFDGVAHILYTHSDYADVWPMYFGQQSKHFEAFSSNYVFVDRHCEDIPKHYTQILYDDSEPYVDRLLTCLAQVPEDIIFLDHEDMILFDYPMMGPLLDYVRVVKQTSAKGTKPRGLDFVRLIRGGKYFSVKYRGARQLRRLLKRSPWIFSIQPSFWKRERLMELLHKHSKEHIWDFEARAQATCREISIRGGFSSARGPKRGGMHWENPVYPFIATAIVKGRWNTGEYGEELSRLFASYGIDPQIRGEC